MRTDKISLSYFVLDDTSLSGYYDDRFYWPSFKDKWHETYHVTLNINIGHRVKVLVFYVHSNLAITNTWNEKIRFHSVR